MFGRLRPLLRQATPAERRGYQRVYCNLCAGLAAQYGARARLFVVYDFASLAWLVCGDDVREQPFRRMNCLQGGVIGRRHRLRPLERFLAAISAYTCAVKVRDDLEDGDSWKARWAERIGAKAFRQAGRTTRCAAPRPAVRSRNRCSTGSANSSGMWPVYSARPRPYWRTRRLGRSPDGGTWNAR